MKKYLLLLTWVVITIGCSNQNEVLQQISRTAECVERAVIARLACGELYERALLGPTRITAAPPHVIS